MTVDDLPHLPEYANEFRPRWPGDDGGFTGEQMRMYARAAIAQAVEKERKAIAELDELRDQRDRLAAILNRAANALKGDPPPLTLWSWHDLPELAAALHTQVALLSAAQAEPQPVEVPEMTDGQILDLPCGQCDSSEEFLLRFASAIITERDAMWRDALHKQKG